MSRITYSIILTPAERETLEAIAAKGNSQATKTKNALILLNCDKQDAGKQPHTNEEIAEILYLNPRTVERIKKKFVEEGLDVALHGHKGTRLYAKKVDGDLEAHLVALSCSSPPEGRARWTLRLLADKVVE